MEYEVGGGVGECPVKGTQSFCDVIYEIYLFIYLSNKFSLCNWLGNYFF